MTIPTPPSTTLSTPSPTERSNPLELDEDKMSSRPIYLIVATSNCSSRLGIGLRNSLPWPPIRADMAFFQKFTRDSRPHSTPISGSINAVIMGRKTYESIPARFRPLGGRLNVIISRTSAYDTSFQIQQSLIEDKKRAEKMLVNRQTVSSPEESEASILLLCGIGLKADDYASHPSAVAPVLCCQSIASALTTLASTEFSMKLGVQIGNISIIGGAEIYSSFLQHDSHRLDNPIRILQTEVRKVDSSEFECDTFFPVPLGAENSEWSQANTGVVSKWINTASEEGTRIQLPQKTDEWARDDKVGVELRVLGWEIVAS